MCGPHLFLGERREFEVPLSELGAVAAERLRRRRRAGQLHKRFAGRSAVGADAHVDPRHGKRREKGADLKARERERTSAREKTPESTCTRGGKKAHVRHPCASLVTWSSEAA